jgi:hypothetical protein
MYTPGPWECFGAHIYSPGEKGANICSISEPRATRYVGYTELKTSSDDLEEAFANARLISAAPELLEAVRDLIEQAESGRQMDLSDARLVVAKATTP